MSNVREVRIDIEQQLMSLDDTTWRWATECGWSFDRHIRLKMYDIELRLVYEYEQWVRVWSALTVVAREIFSVGAKCNTEEFYLRYLEALTCK